MTAVIHIEGLEKRFGKVRAVDDVSLTVEEGEAFGYLGPNGAGKTTTIRCLLGVVRPTAGGLRVFGRDVARELRSILTDIGYLPGEWGLWPQMSGAAALEYLGRLHPGGTARRDELCERFDLSEHDLERQVRFYSRGMRQKLGIVQAFQHRPHLVVLDEPTEGLDPVMKERFVELLTEHRKDGGTVFLSSHILSEVELATDRVAVLKEGQLVRVGPTLDLTGERIRHCTLVLRSAEGVEALRSIEGVSGFEGDGNRFRFDVRGDMGPVMRVLGGLDVEEFLSEPEHLSEAFFDVYGEG